MTAPLTDQRGNVRYFIGAQIDITRLLEGGRGLESFKQLLDQQREVSIRAQYDAFTDNRPSLRMLHELGDLLDDEEASVVRQRRTRRFRGSMSSIDSISPRGSPVGRRYIGTEELSENSTWPPPKFGPQGRLPGVYQNVRYLSPDYDKY